MMGGMKTYWLILIALLIGAKAQSQVNFSRFEYNPLLTNPAEVAASNFYKLGFNNRRVNLDQGIRLNSSQFYGIMPLVNKDLRKLGGIGLQFIEDAEIGGTDFKHQEINLSLGYNLWITPNQTLSFGINNSFHQNRIAVENFTTGSQWVRNVGYDPSMISGEQFEEDQVSYYSIGSGLLWSQHDENRRRTFELGLAMYHLNQPDNSFLGESTSLPMSLSATGGFRVLDKEKYSIYPLVQYTRQGEIDQINAGAVASFYFQNDNPFNPITNGNLDVSLRYLQDQAISMGVGVVQDFYDVGFSFNIPTGKEVDKVYRNAIEFYVVLKKPVKTRKVVATRRIDNYNVGQIRQFYKKQELLEQTSIAENDTASAVEALQFKFKKNLNFELNDSKINSSSEAYLNDLVQVMEENPNLGLIIIGHTDNTGSEKVNEEVSLERAQSVKDFLVDKGVAGRRIKAVGNSYNDPLVENDSPENRAKNRRVEFILYEK